MWPMMDFLIYIELVSWKVYYAASLKLQDKEFNSFLSTVLKYQAYQLEDSMASNIMDWSNNRTSLGWAIIFG